MFIKISSKLKIVSTVGLNYNHKVINIPKPTHRLFIHVLWQAKHYKSRLNLKLHRVSVIKTWEIQVLSKPEFLNASFLNFFNCSWSAPKLKWKGVLRIWQL